MNRISSDKVETKSFDKALEEHNSTPKKGKFSTPPKKEKVRKQQMSIVLTPENKEKLRVQADKVGMSASELIAYWIEANDL